MNRRSERSPRPGPYTGDGLRSGTPVIRHRPIDADAIAERILAAKADGIHHEPPEHMTVEPAHFPAQKPKPTSRRQR